MEYFQSESLWRTNGMTKDKISLQNIKNIERLEVNFIYPESNIIVLTGKNGVGKTTLVKALHLVNDPDIFAKTSPLNSLHSGSQIDIEIAGFDPFSFKYNATQEALDTRDKLPKTGLLTAEQAIPNGQRFKQYAQVASFDGEIRNNISASNYKGADQLSEFLNTIYASNKFANLLTTKVKGNNFYFKLLEDDHYLREDHFSSGEFFLVQMFRLITSGAKLIIVDELDVALDAATQVRLYETIRPLLTKYETRAILVSHSLAFMSTVDDGGLYYLEQTEGGVSLEQRSFGYIKADLYGFSGYDRYILTEDPVLEGFIEYIIRAYEFTPFYQHKTIGVGAVSQVKSIVEKNDSTELFATPENVVAIVDSDVFLEFDDTYDGPTKILKSPVEDLEKYIFRNRGSILTDVPLPPFREMQKEKDASKIYWKYLINDQKISVNYLYKLIHDNETEKTNELSRQIIEFLSI